MPEQMKLAGPADEQHLPGGVNDPQLQAVGASVQVDQAEARRDLRRPGGGAVKQELNPVLGAQGRRNLSLHPDFPAVGAQGFALTGKKDAGAAVGTVGLGGRGQQCRQQERRSKQPAADKIGWANRAPSAGDQAGWQAGFSPHAGFSQKKPQNAAILGPFPGFVCRKTPLLFRFSTQGPWRRPKAALPDRPS